MTWRRREPPRTGSGGAAQPPSARRPSGPVAGDLSDSPDIPAGSSVTYTLVANLDPAALEANLTEIIRRTRTRYPGTAVVLAGMEAPPNLGPLYTQAFRDVFVRVATEEGTDLIPFLLDGVAGLPELNQSDRIHPTAEGHRIVAAVAWRVLEDLLRARLP